MKQSKHAPGPWVRNMGALKDANGRVIEVAGLGMAHFSGDDKDEAAHANSDLIAAAPEMLAALKSLEYWFDTDQEILDEMSEDERRDNASKLEMIRAAIAKAEGA